MTVLELAHWIIHHRKNGAFDYPLDELATEISSCNKTGLFICVTNSSGLVVGVVCGQLLRRKKELIIHDILTIKPGVLKQIGKLIVKQYPKYKISGFRRGSKRYFNARKILKRL